jgi:hypothetical protein
MSVTVVTTPPSVLSPVPGKSTQGEEDLIFVTTRQIKNFKDPAEAMEALRNVDDRRGMIAYAHGGILKRIKEEKWYESEACPYFSDFLIKKGIPRSTAYAHIALYEGLVKPGISWHQVEPVGWTKIRYIAPVLDKDNVDDWLQRAAKVTVPELIQIVKHEKSLLKKGAGASPTGVSTQVDAVDANLLVPDGSVAPAKISRTFQFHEDQVKTIDDAIDKAKEQTCSPYDHQALDAICMNFLAGNMESFAESHHFRRAVRQLGYEAVVTVIADLWPNIDITVEVRDDEEE